MSRTTKILILIAIALVIVGLVIFTIVMSALGWDFTKLNTKNIETNEHIIEEEFSNISIKTDTADIVFVPSQEGEYKVVCQEREKEKHEVTVQNGTLCIKYVDSRKWYEHIGISFGSTKITVYIPAEKYGDLSINESTGNIEIPKELLFENIDIKASTGDVNNYASASGNIKISVSTGDINVEGLAAKDISLSVSTGKVTAADITVDGDISLRTSTGNTTLSNITCKNFTSKGTTGKLTMQNVIASERFDIERNTGDVNFNGCDAGEIKVKTSTGDVTGSFLSDKVIFPSTDTGRTDYPKCTSGDICEITTSTGDIIIKIN